MAQDEQSIDPKKVHQEGLTILAKENPTGFERVVALGKFRKSQNLLNKNGNKNENLREINDNEIKKLTEYFARIEDPDSLLRLTIFYPDTIFQNNKKFSKRIKDKAIDVLEIKRRAQRKKFSKVENLNYRDQSNPNSSRFILTFENYWPLEVMEFEKHFIDLNLNYTGLPAKIKEELIFTQLKSEFDSIDFSLKNNSLNLNISNIQQQKESLEKELKFSEEKYNKAKTIGIGMLGLILLWVIFFRRKSSQLLKNSNQKLLEEKKRSEELLLNILPAEVAKELKNQASVKAKKHEAVTVLFSDFKNFSKIANRLEPEILIQELDFCFKAFDRIIDKHRLQKIKTIGDAYMCVGGLYTKGSNHVGRIILAALEIQRFLNNIKKEREANGQTFFEARIGIHIGPVVSGVVGSKKFAFDIWGDTVNVAQQMETNGSPGKVNISGEIYALINDHFECTHRGKVTAKNKKEFDMYFVERHLNTPDLKKDIYLKK